MSTRTFTLDQLEEWGVAYENVFTEEIDSGRWTRYDRIVFRAVDDEKFYEMTYETGLTEHQDLDRSDRYSGSTYDDTGVWVVTLSEVSRVEKVVTVTEWVAA